MQRFMLKSKLHRATVTDADLHYEGSISIDEQLMGRRISSPMKRSPSMMFRTGSDLKPTSFRAPRDSGTICLNGAAARKVARGDLIIIASYVMVDEADAANWAPKCILVDEKNRIKHRQA